MVAERFDDARKDAQKVDEIIKNGTIPRDVLEREKPFFGVPFTTKDCIAVKGKWGKLCKGHVCDGGRKY